MDITLTRIGDVFVLNMGDGENRFNAESVAALNASLDDVARVATGEEPEQIALVTTGSGKIFSNGIDLEWMLGCEPSDIEAFMQGMLGVWARVMSLPIPTVAAINGHAFAGGAMFSLAHDHVLMREDRGYWCVNEALLGLPFAPGMQSILQARLPAPTARRAMLTAHRFGAAEAIEAGIADGAHPLEELESAAVELAQSLVHTASATLGRIKEDMYAPTLALLRAGALPD